MQRSIDREGRGCGERWVSDQAGQGKDNKEEAVTYKALQCIMAWYSTKQRQHSTVSQ